jgi:soluble lytic murein transglycosylase
MPFLRACLVSTVFAAAAWAQDQPPGSVRSGEVVMMQPLPERGASGAAGDLSGPRPSRLRFLPAADHDMFVRAFEAASRGDWVAARSLASQGQNPISKRLLEWRFALDKNSGATFAEIDAVIKDTDSKTSAGTWPLRGTLQARAEAAITPDMQAASVAAWFRARPPNSSIG